MTRCDHGDCTEPATSTKGEHSFCAAHAPVFEMKAERRAPVQDERRAWVWRQRGRVDIHVPAKPAGTIAWFEHLEAFAGYAKCHGHEQSAERLAERGGFSYGELIAFLGREPTTWRAR